MLTKYRRLRWQLSKKTLVRKQSMLDLVLGDALSLSLRPGRQDQQKLDEYLSSVGDFERCVDRTEQWLDIPKAKVDPESLNLNAKREIPLDFVRAMYDLMFLAFQADTMRVSTLSTYCWGPRAVAICSIARWCFTAAQPARRIEPASLRVERDWA